MDARRHAGYAYSGPTAAFSFVRLQPERIKRIFVLGPSHRLYTPKCLLTGCQIYETPLGDIKIDAEVNRQLAATGQFGTMALEADEAEHSLEMQLPYIAHVMRGRDYTLVPIMVGSLNEQRAAAYGKILAPYLNEPGNVFVISSDFCHWGSRFRFTHYEPEHGEIWQSIEALDRQGMQLIEKQDPAGFAAYLARLENTICGRHPISVYLYALREASQLGVSAPRRSIRFTRYAQSSRCRTAKDSSVSYAAAVVVAESAQQNRNAVTGEDGQQQAIPDEDGSSSEDE